MSGRGRQGSRFAQRYIDWFPSFVGAAPVPSTLPGARLIFGPTVPMTMGTQSEWWGCKAICVCVKLFAGEGANGFLRRIGERAPGAASATPLCCMWGATPLYCMRGHSRCTMPLLCIGMRRWTIHPTSPSGARLFVEGLLRPFLLRRSVCLVRLLQFADVVTFVVVGRVHALDEGVATFSARSAGDDICTAMVQCKQE